MAVRLVITTYAKPGKGAELARAMADRCQTVQQEPGCQQYEVFQPPFRTTLHIIE
jgi:quinol monooxygenase YgiN